MTALDVLSPEDIEDTEDDAGTALMSRHRRYARARRRLAPVQPLIRAIVTEALPRPHSRLAVAPDIPQLTTGGPTAHPPRDGRQ